MKRIAPIPRHANRPIKCQTDLLSILMYFEKRPNRLLFQDHQSMLNQHHTVQTHSIVKSASKVSIDNCVSKDTLFFSMMFQCLQLLKEYLYHRICSMQSNSVCSMILPCSFSTIKLQESVRLESLLPQNAIAHAIIGAKCCGH
jgi:hypothetical protein